MLQEFQTLPRVKYVMCIDARPKSTSKMRASKHLMPTLNAGFLVHSSLLFH